MALNPPPQARLGPFLGLRNPSTFPFLQHLILLKGLCSAGDPSTPGPLHFSPQKLRCLEAGSRQGGDAGGANLGTDA